MGPAFQSLAKNLSEDEKELLIGIIAGFLFDYPLKEIKSRLWIFYKTWVCNGAKVADPDEHEDNMLFYHDIIEFFKYCSDILKMEDN